MKKDSLKFTILDHWLVKNLKELKNARLKLKIAYLAYSTYCESRDYPVVPIQGFSKILLSLQPTWPTSYRRRTSRGTLLINLTLSTWVGQECEWSDKLAPVQEHKAKGS